MLWASPIYSFLSLSTPTPHRKNPTQKKTPQQTPEWCFQVLDVLSIWNCHFQSHLCFPLPARMQKPYYIPVFGTTIESFYCIFFVNSWIYLSCTLNLIAAVCKSLVIAQCMNSRKSEFGSFRGFLIYDAIKRAGLVFGSKDTFLGHLWCNH